MADMASSPDNTLLRDRLFRVLRVAVTVVLLYWVLSQVGLGQVVGTLSKANLWQFGLALLLYQVGVGIRAVRWWVLLRGSGVSAPPGQLLGLHYITQFFNVSLPTGFAGDVVRAVEFKGSDSTATSAGVVLLDRVMGFITLFIVALVGLALGRRLLDPRTASVLTVISVVGLAAVAVVFQDSLLRRLTGFLPERLSLAGEGWLARLYSALTGCSRSGLVLGLVVSALNTVLVIAIHYLIGRSLGVRLSIGVFFIVTPIVNLSLLVPTVSGLGLREVGYQILLVPLGVPAEVAVALGLGVYLARLSAGLLGGLYYLVWSVRR